MHGAQGSGTSSTLPSGPLQPILVDSTGSKIGLFVGTTSTYNQSGTPVKAYELVTRTGFIAALQPNGKLGGVRELLFQSDDCTGRPNIAVHQANTVNDVVPGYVLSHGHPSRVLVIPGKATIRKLNLKSVSRVSIEGFICEKISLSKLVYLVAENNAITTGVSTTDFGEIRVQMAPIKKKQSKVSRESLLKKLLAAPGNTTSNDFATEQCSPGCDLEYISNGICEPECNINACGYDFNDCTLEEVEAAKEYEKTLCAPACEPGDLGDGFCDTMCNNTSCNFDEGDCKTINSNQ